MAGSDLFTGTLDILILKAVSWGPRHGYAIGRWIRETTAEDVIVQEGALYPALHRLERKKWIAADWAVSENRQRVRVYRLTAGGRKQLVIERTRWEQLTEAIAGVMRAPLAEGES